MGTVFCVTTDRGTIVGGNGRLGDGAGDDIGSLTNMVR